MSAQLLRGGVVFDGHEVLGQRDVLVVDGIIEAVGVDLPAGGAEVLACSGATVLPGLVDAHVHLGWAGLDPPPETVEASLARARANAAALLAAGVTTVRDVGGPLEVLAALTGSPGPDVLHCGQILCAPKGHGTEIPLAVPIARECDGPEAFDVAVREQLAAGARAVKVTLNGSSGEVELTTYELLAVVEAAHAWGARVAAHASVRDAVALAVACGVDSVEHGNGLDLELARTMRAKDIALVPTVVIFEEVRAQLEGDDTFLPPDQVHAWRCAASKRVEEHGPSLAAAREAGLVIGLGTDRVPGGKIVAVVDELEALVRQGFTPVEALRAATSGGAAVLGLTDRGVIAPGLRADLVVVDGDVTADLAVLRSPRRVLQASSPASTPSAAAP